MESDILFIERQRFTQWWLWLILLGILGYHFYSIFNLLAAERNLMTNPGLLISTAIIGLISLLLLGVRLETQINSEGIHVRLFPFHLSFRNYPWTSIKKSFVRQYEPIGEFGGWGIRFGLFHGGRAFNMSGNMGLQLEFNDGGKLLIGTNKPDELKRVIERLEKLES